MSTPVRPPSSYTHEERRQIVEEARAAAREVLKKLERLAELEEELDGGHGVADPA